MSRLYDTVEPAVIDESLLKHCIEEQGPTGEAGKLAKKDEIEYKDVKELRLDFKNVLKIDNLWGFKGLVKLQLDNNIIEKIEGLTSLSNLRWLDLSFNNIELIEGMDQLTQLRDLSLFNNRIEKIGNMDNLKELQVLSIGNNKLENLEELLYLRRFQNLNTLNVHGNPLCNQSEYHNYIVAHLPNLVYLDYRLVDNAKREDAIETYKDSIDELVHDEMVVERKKTEEDEKMAELIIYKEAYVDDLNGPALFDSMFDEDAEAEKLLQLPGVSELVASYKEKFIVICKKIFEFGLKERIKRKAEVDSFFTALYTGVENNLLGSVKHITEFDTTKTKVLAELLTIGDFEIIERQLADISNKVTQLWDVLMGLEMQLVDQLEDSIKDFERSMTDMVGGFVEQVQDLVSQLRDLESNHHEKLSDVAVVTLEKLMKNELEEEIPDDVRMLFVDRDTIMNAVSSSHDAHSFRIDNKEDDMITRVNTNVQSMIETIHSDEVKRNRSRVMEINNLLDHYREQIENFESNYNM